MTARNIRLLAAHGFLTECKLYAPVAVLYFQEVTGSFTAAMGVIAAGVVTATALEIPTGILSDRIGRKKTIILSAFAFCLYVLLMAVADSQTVLFCAVFAAGLSDALGSGNNNALLYESVRQAGQKEKFNAVMGRINALGQAALCLAAIAGGALLALGASLNDLIWLSLAPQAARTVLCFFITEPPRDRALHGNIFHGLREAFALLRRTPRLRLLVPANALQFGVGEAAHRFGPAFFQTVWPLWAINVFAGLRYILGTAGYGLAGRVIARFGEARVLQGGAALMAAFGIAAALLQSALSPLLVYMNSLFHGPAAVAKEHLLQQDFSDTQRATMGSLSEFCASLVTAAAALLLGVIADAAGPAMAFLVAMVLRVPVVWMYGRI